MKAKSRRYYQKNKEEIDAKIRAYRANPITKQKRRLYGEKIREKHNAQERERYQRNKETINAKKRERFTANYWPVCPHPPILRKYTNSTHGKRASFSQNSQT